MGGILLAQPDSGGIGSATDLVVSRILNKVEGALRRMASQANLYRETHSKHRFVRSKARGPTCRTSNSTTLLSGTGRAQQKSGPLMARLFR